jgi:hypothetical protein
LVSVRQLTRDNNVSIEFDPTGFSVKDLPTRTVMLRCESSGALYPLRLPPQLGSPSALPRPSTCGTLRLGIRDQPFFVKFYTTLISVVIKQLLILATRAELGNMCASFYLIPVLVLIFPSN